MYAILELSSEFELRQKTCWSFKSKVQQAMESSLNQPLTGTIHVDEFMFGGPEEDKKGRSKGLKSLRNQNKRIENGIIRLQYRNQVNKNRFVPTQLQ